MSFAMAVISCMWCVVGLCVLLVSVSCDESCPTWLHPSEDSKCVCLPLYTWVVCENETLLNMYVCVVCVVCAFSYRDKCVVSLFNPC